MKSTIKGLLVCAAGLISLSATSNAQVVLNGAGSSAMFLELGQGAQVAPASATCLFTAASGSVKLTDTSSGTTLTDNGTAWVAWTPTGGSCAASGSSSQIYEYVNTDSVVGDRCLFNGAAGTCAISNSFPQSGTLQSTAHLIYSGTGDVAGEETAVMPAAIAAALNAATTPTFSGTDIRPEDAEFAITRATGGPTFTGTPVCNAVINQYNLASAAGNPTQYRTLGYANGSQIVGFSGSLFNVINFSLPSSFSVTPLGATPIIVFAQGPGGRSPNTGFGNPAVTNLNRSTLGLYLDGTLGFTRDAFTPGATGADTSMATVFVREPLSGTYNTMEYNVPNSVELQTSQDVGQQQVDISAPTASGAFNRNCNLAHNAPAWNSTGVAMGTLEGNLKERAIGTGQEVSDVLATPNSLGYAFWSAANFKNAGANTKYLTVDGVDPLGVGEAGTLGDIPTAANGLLPNVTLAHVADGTYPIWSLLRLVTLGSGATSSAQGLAQAAQQFVSATTPDFVPFNNSVDSTIPNMAVERAHFTPPGIYDTLSDVPTPQNGNGGTFTEVGGDVGGLPIPYQADLDYCFAYSGSTTSCTATNTFTGTTAPSSVRRQ